MRRRRWLVFPALALALATYVGGTIWAADTPDAKPTSAAPAPQESEQESVDPLTGQSADAAVKSGACLADPAVLEDLQEQREKLARQAKDLAAKEAELKSREQAVTDEIKKLEDIRASIAKMQELHKEENAEKVAKLVDMMQTMSPKSAAKVMSELDESLAVATMEQMDTTKLAKIMNNMEPKKSSRLSEILAGVVRAGTAAEATSTELARAQPAEANRTTSSIQSEKGGDQK